MVQVLRSLRARARSSMLGPLLSREERRSVAVFLRSRSFTLGVDARIRFLWRCLRISGALPSPHTQEEILTFAAFAMGLSPEVEGVLVEAGCFKGSSTAKFSLVADLANRNLFVFDSFEGIPDNSEPEQTTLLGGVGRFRKGDYAGSLAEVSGNVQRWGAAGRCRFVPGWLEETLPSFGEKVAAAYLDVDLASSTRTAIRLLYPRLVPGGRLFSQDGHLPLVIEVFRDDRFWEEEVGCAKPVAEGLGERKLIWVTKPA